MKPYKYFRIKESYKSHANSSKRQSEKTFSPFKYEHQDIDAKNSETL